MLESARPATRHSARHVRRRALADHLDGPGGARGLDADERAEGRARRSRQARARAPRDRRDHGRRRCLHLGKRHLPAGDRHLGRRDGRAAPRSAAPRRGKARLDARSRRRARPQVRGRGAPRGRVGADLVDRADPLRRDARRARGRGDRRGGRHDPPAALGATPRCRRGLALRHPDRDGVRPEPARPLAHEARGHEARAPRALGAKRSTGWRRRRSRPSPRACPRLAVRQCTSLEVWR